MRDLKETCTYVDDVLNLSARLGRCREVHALHSRTLAIACDQCEKGSEDAAGLFCDILRGTWVCKGSYDHGCKQSRSVVLLRASFFQTIDGRRAF